MAAVAEGSSDAEEGQGARNGGGESADLGGTPAEVREIEIIESETIAERYIEPSGAGIHFDPTGFSGRGGYDDVLSIAIQAIQAIAKNVCAVIVSGEAPVEGYWA
jgi:hypothetical protein